MRGSCSCFLKSKSSEVQSCSFQLKTQKMVYKKRCWETFLDRVLRIIVLFFGWKAKYQSFLSCCAIPFSVLPPSSGFVGWCSPLIPEAIPQQLLFPSVLCWAQGRWRCEEEGVEQNSVGELCNCHEEVRGPQPILKGADEGSEKRK